MRARMATGRVYMDSLTRDDVHAWIGRTKQILSESPNTYAIGVYGSGGKPIPPDLDKLGIIRIDIVDKDEVRYVWMGGLDHTELEVHRLEDGSFKLIAHYNDERSKVIWPKQ